MRAEGDADDRRPPSLADEIARLSRLKAQVEHPLEGHAYDLRRPADGWSRADLAGAGGHRRLLAAWMDGIEKPAGSPEAQRQRLWIAIELAKSHRRAGNGRAARDVLAQAVAVLADEGLRDLARCQLAEELLTDGEVEAAARALDACDPAPEVVDLDGPHRAASARLRIARGDFEGAIRLVGQREGDVPAIVSVRLPLAVLRVHALESLGRLDDAWTGLAESRAVLGEDETRKAFASAGLAPSTMKRDGRAQLDVLARERDDVPIGVRTAAWPLAGVPVAALAGVVAVTIPRCACDADPFMGAHGHVLCPSACKACEGPFRIYTPWYHNGGEHSTDGPRYFCRTPANRVGAMTQDELGSNVYKLGAYELSWAPAAATYITFVLLALPFVPLFARRRHDEGVARRAALERRIAELASRLGVAPPAAVVAQPSTGLARSAGLVALALVVPLVIVIAELASR